MKQLFFILLVFGLFVISCKKESVNTTPSISLKKVSTDVVPVNGSLQFIFSYGDKQADIDSIFIYRTRLNIKTVSARLNDITKLAVPEHEKNQTGEIYLDFITDGMGRNDYQKYLISAVFPPISGNPPRSEADTMSYKFVAIDKDKNVSDTVYYSPIVILR
ncbi:MAG: hypothetical protein KF781_04615 [Chitinophagaceae bacterium]|nr:hypothetical protein [Chitinophagaceae bacterium]MCW5904633.1 hypothetical protein [Chitinophagaceae bacterium]